MSQYLSLPGTNNHDATTPNHADLQIVGDVDLITRLAAVDWTPSSQRNCLGKISGFEDDGYGLEISGASNGVLRLVWDDGTSKQHANSTVGVSFVDGQAGWIRATLDVDNGGGAYEAKFYVSAENTNDDTAVTWSQLGATVTGGSTTQIQSSTELGIVGAQGSGGFGPFVGNIYQGIIKAGIAGTKVAHFNADDFTVGDSSGATAVDVTGKTWTLEGAATVIQAESSESSGSLLFLGVG